MKIISIIIATYNSEQYLERAIKSIISQSILNQLEIIIIDGQSTDNTLNIIKKYDRYIYYMISEKDNGIYNALNKGVHVANGKYIYCLGSDDFLVDGSLERVSNYLNEDYDIISGKVWLLDECNSQRMVSGKKITFEEISHGEMLPHQGMFIKKELVTFDEKYKIAADYKLLLLLIKKGKSIKYIEDLIAFYSVGGISSVQTNALIYEYKKIIIECVSEKEAEIYIRRVCSIKQRIKTLIKLFVKFVGIKRYMNAFLGWENIKKISI